MWQRGWLCGGPGLVLPVVLVFLVDDAGLVADRGGSGERWKGLGRRLHFFLPGSMGLI